MGFDFEVESIEIRTIVLGSAKLYLFSSMFGMKITQNMKCDTQKQSLVWNYNCTMTTGSIEVDGKTTDIVCPGSEICDEYAMIDLHYDGKKHYLTADSDQCFELRPMKPWFYFVLEMSIGHAFPLYLEWMAPFLLIYTTSLPLLFDSAA